MIDILAGAFGSGKTELCMNLAMEAATQHPVLADLDIVNPYFCSREQQEALEEAGISFVGPTRRLSLADVPYISPEIISCIRSDRRLFLDVGGDESGSAVLGYLSKEILTRPYHMYMVINPFRPFTETEGEAGLLREALEKASRLRFTAVISNPNLAAATSAEDVIEGHRKVESMARSMGLPLHFLVVEKRLQVQVEACLRKAVEEGSIRNVEIYPVQMRLRPDWF